MVRPKSPERPKTSAAILSDRKFEAAMAAIRRWQARMEKMRAEDRLILSEIKKFIEREERIQRMIRLRKRS